MRPGAAATDGDDGQPDRCRQAERELRHGEICALFHHHLIRQQRQHGTTAHRLAAQQR